MLNQTLSEIDNLVSRINTHPEYSGCVWREKYHALMEEAAKHSLDIELLADEKKISRKERESFLKRLNGAENFLAREGISPYSLSRLGYETEPDKNPSSGFRNILVGFGGFYGTESEKIPFEINDLVIFLKHFQSHPVVRAAQAHLELVRIHPYMDGNGRAARLLQNFCLQEMDYPPALILAGNRNEYLTTLGKVLNERLHEKTNLYSPSDAENGFYDFVAQGVLLSSKELEKELRKKRMYEVKLANVSNPGMVGTVAKMIRGIGRQTREGGIVVSINKKNGHKHGESLRITGDIGQEEIRESLERFCSRYSLKFVLTGKYC
ncbi:Fic family protein [Candidatus Pacearchaeota archaeon]|nr:Fic family protein [Candidatus Pacearchaeota archaeon]